MKTVSDIALVLHVRNEQVRRWIRSGELRATKKDGWIIEDSDFMDFLVNKPKYEKIYYLETYNHKPPSRKPNRIKESEENRRGLKYMLNTIKEGLSES